MKNWISQNKIEFYFLLALILISAFLRFYRLGDYMTFLGDEGRDAIVVKRFLTEFHPPLLGPVTSVGNMYLGPLYYYMMALVMSLFWLNPVAASGMVALLGVLTVGLIYYLTRAWFGKISGFVAASLYCISPVTIYYSRSSWNPNPAPFFALLGIFSLHRLHVTKNYRWLILTAISTAFAVQMHYLALILVPIYGAVFIYELINDKKRKHLSQGVIGAVVTFLILMSPLLIFDLRHNFMNFNNMKSFFTNRETTVNLNAFNSIGRILPNYFDVLIGRLIAADNKSLSIALGLVVLLSVLVNFKKWPAKVLGIWLGIAILGLALYKQTVYVHYLGFVLPVPFILIGGLFSNFSGKLRIVLAALTLALLTYVNVPKNYLLQPPQKQLERTQSVARFIIEKSQGEDFNFALISKHNYDAAYQYYLDLYNHKPKVAPNEITNQLFVVCEDSVCTPINHQKYEIAAFGWAKIESQEEFNGVKVFKLTHNEDGKKD